MKASRYIAYPDGALHLASVLARFASEDEPNFSKKILSDVDLSLGAFYITVPFDCPEDLYIEDLNYGKFYLETEESRQKGERHRGDVMTMDQTNESIYEMIRTQGFHLGFDRWDPPRHTKPPKQDEAVFIGVTRRCFSGADHEDVLASACYNSIDELRFLVKPSAAITDQPEDLLGASGEHLAMIACSIFDWTGYLLWFPRQQRSADA